MTTTTHERTTTNGDHPPGNVPRAEHGEINGIESLPPELQEQLQRDLTIEATFHDQVREYFWIREYGENLGIITEDEIFRLRDDAAKRLADRDPESMHTGARDAVVSVIKSRLQHAKVLGEVEFTSDVDEALEIYEEARAISEDLKEESSRLWKDRFDRSRDLMNRMANDDSSERFEWAGGIFDLLDEDRKTSATEYRDRLRVQAEEEGLSAELADRICDDLAQAATLACATQQVAEAFTAKTKRMFESACEREMIEIGKLGVDDAQREILRIAATARLAVNHYESQLARAGFTPDHEDTEGEAILDKMIALAGLIEDPDTTFSGLGDQKLEQTKQAFEQFEQDERAYRRVLREARAARRDEWNENSTWGVYGAQGIETAAEGGSEPKPGASPEDDPQDPREAVLDQALDEAWDRFVQLDYQAGMGVGRAVKSEEYQAARDVLHSVLAERLGMELARLSAEGMDEEGLKQRANVAAANAAHLYSQSRYEVMRADNSKRARIARKMLEWEDQGKRGFAKKMLTKAGIAVPFFVVTTAAAAAGTPVLGLGLVAGGVGVLLKASRSMPLASIHARSREITGQEKRAEALEKRTEKNIRNLNSERVSSWHAHEVARVVLQGLEEQTRKQVRSNRRRAATEVTLSMLSSQAAIWALEGIPGSIAAIDRLRYRAVMELQEIGYRTGNSIFGRVQTVRSLGRFGSQAAQGEALEFANGAQQQISGFTGNAQVKMDNLTGATNNWADNIGRRGSEVFEAAFQPEATTLTAQAQPGDGFEELFRREFGLSSAQASEMANQFNGRLAQLPGTYTLNGTAHLAQAGEFNFGELSGDLRQAAASYSTAT